MSDLMLITYPPKYYLFIPSTPGPTGDHSLSILITNPIIEFLNLVGPRGQETKNESARRERYDLYVVAPAGLGFLP
jgi:hypothetical protein